jgi:aspartyl-tRNA(Asn)/glutamyl-tRNA(Gln) amidotransferase subunit C
MKEDLSKKQVKDLAKLVNFSLDEAEIEKFRGECFEILDYVKLIQKLNLKKVSPMAHAVPVKNVFRKDVNRDGSIPTPKYFKTKKIL